MEEVRLAELCASTSLFTDLGTGQPAEHGLRTCLVAMRLAQALGLEPDEARETFYATLLRFLGCTADAHEVADTAGGDELSFFAGLSTVTMGSAREEIAQLVRLVAADQPLPTRLRALARELADAGAKDRLLRAHCEVAARLATEMGLPPGVVSALDAAYARWDGRGTPRGVGGNEIPRSMRIAIVARDLELWARENPGEAAQTLMRRRGRTYDPDIVDTALAIGIGELRHCREDLWDVVVSLEPDPHAMVTGPGIDRALTALGDFADLKAPEFAGHSRRVTRLAAEAAGLARLPPRDQTILRRAAMVHDLGVVAVPTGTWRSVRPFGPADLERIRLHPLWTSRILGRCGALEDVAGTAARHHERDDGSGYPAGVRGGSGRACGLLACAEFFDEESSAGRGHPPGDAETVAADLAGLAGSGAFSTLDVDAVLGAAGVRRPLIEVSRPAGLTEREVDVLRLLARGHTNRQIADELGISPRTVGTHVEHVYDKAGVRSRAAATLFAMQHDIVGPAVRREVG